MFCLELILIVKASYFNCYLCHNNKLSNGIYSLNDILVEKHYDNNKNYIILYTKDPLGFYTYLASNRFVNEIIDKMNQ